MVHGEEQETVPGPANAGAAVTRGRAMTPAAMTVRNIVSPKVKRDKWAFGSGCRNSRCLKSAIIAPHVRVVRSACDARRPVVEILRKHFGDTRSHVTRNDVWADVTLRNTPKHIGSRQTINRNKAIENYERFRPCFHTNGVGFETP